jgi:hypothetical protein
MKDAERPGKQRICESAAAVRPHDGDQAKPRSAWAVPHPRQTKVLTASRIDGDQVGGRVELRVKGLFVKVAGIPFPPGGAGHVAAQDLVERSKLVFVGVGAEMMTTPSGSAVECRPVIFGSVGIK